MEKETKQTQVTTLQNVKAPAEFPYKFEAVQGSFVDYKGAKRNFIMTAVSVPMLAGADLVDAAFRRLGKLFQGVSNKELEKYSFRTASVQQQVGNTMHVLQLQKGLYFGIAVTKAEDADVYNTEVGLRIALGRALNANKEENVHAIFSTHPGMFSTESVRAILMNEAKFFTENPGSYMGGYNEARDKYLASQKASE